jgi:hypothetical protein
MEDHFEIIPYIDLDTPTIGHIKLLHNHTNVLKNLSNTLSHNLDQVKVSDEISQSKLKDLDGIVNRHSYINWPMIGLCITVGFILLTWAAKICITKRRAPNNTAETNTDS